MLGLGESCLENDGNGFFVSRIHFSIRFVHSRIKSAVKCTEVVYSMQKQTVYVACCALRNSTQEETKSVPLILEMRLFCLRPGMWLSAPTVPWSTEADSTGMETRTQWKQWSEQRSSTSGLGWEQWNSLNQILCRPIKINSQAKFSVVYVVLSTVRCICCTFLPVSFMCLLQELIQNDLLSCLYFYKWFITIFFLEQCFIIQCHCSVTILYICTTERLLAVFVSFDSTDLLASFQSDGFLKDNNNAAQRLLDGVKYISQSVSELSVKPAKAVTSWLTDQIAPAYWKPNSLILVCHLNASMLCSTIAKWKHISNNCALQKCHKCGEEFQPNDTKHHCRACGEGFCDSCSTKTRPVPERGWGLAPVRVCEACFHNRGIPTGKFFLMLTVGWIGFWPCEGLMSCIHNFPVTELLDAALEEEGGTLIARKVGEAVQNTLGAVVGAIDIPLGENLI